MTDNTLIEAARANIEAFLAHVEANSGSLIHLRGKTLRPTDLRSLLSSHKRMEAENAELRLAICGGEDAPGHNGSLTHEAILGVLRDNYASWERDAEMAWDGDTATSWKARANRMEEALRGVHKWSLVIDSAVRADQPESWRPILSAIKAVTSALASLQQRGGEVG